MSDEEEDTGLFSTRDHGMPTGSDWGPAIWLRLNRYAKPDTTGSPVTRSPVLLLHGGSANHQTFTVPGVGLADWLFEAGFDPWLLDWRGSSLVTDDPRNDLTLRHQSDLYTFSRAAREDLPAAIARMRSFGVQAPIAAVGHCMGSAVIAEAIALHSTGTDIDRIVLLALGLFYEAPIDSRLKSEERILERLTRSVSADPVIDPRLNDDGTGTLLHPWPDELEKLYRVWPRALRAHLKGTEPVIGMCNRLSFMYGLPFRHENLVSGIHEITPPPEPPPPADTTALQGDKPTLADHFGGFPLKMYLNAARNLRVGHATPVAESDPAIDLGTAQQRFRDLMSVTLITGELNRLWHRDSIDRMHEWLCRGSSRSSRKIRKHVLPNFAHQDLLWAADSPSRVYPHIAEGLGMHIIAPDPSRSRHRPPAPPAQSVP